MIFDNKKFYLEGEKMKKGFFILFVVFTLLSLTGCMKQRYDDENFYGATSTDLASCTQASMVKIEQARELLKNIGLAGEIDLIKPAIVRGVRGEFRGGFLVGTSGKIESYSSVIFWWKTIDGRRFASELPLDKIVFQDTTDTPKLHLIFKIEYYENAWWRKNFKEVQRNPNEIIRPNFVYLTTIKISEADIDKYLEFK